MSIDFAAILEAGILVVFSEDWIVSKTIQTEKGSASYRRLLLRPKQQLIAERAATPRSSYHEVVKVECVVTSFRPDDAILGEETK